MINWKNYHKKTPKKRVIRTRSVTGGNANNSDNRQLHAVGNAEKKTVSSRKVDSRKKTSARRAFSACSSSDEQTDRCTQNAVHRGSGPRLRIPTYETDSDGNASNRDNIQSHAVGSHRKNTVLAKKVTMRKKVSARRAHHRTVTSSGSVSDEQSDRYTQSAAQTGSVPCLRVPTDETVSDGNANNSHNRQYHAVDNRKKRTVNTQ